MTVAELLARISSHELSEWMAYEQVAGPLGGARHDQLTAMITHTLASIWRGDGPPYPFEQFLPAWATSTSAAAGDPVPVDDDSGGGPPLEPWQVLKAKVAHANRLLGGRDLRGGTDVDAGLPDDPP
jgi:hypothetical protein